VPALAICVVVTALLTCLVVPRSTASLWTGLLALVGSSNVFLYQEATDYFGSSGLLNTFTQTWYLGVDYQFYLIFPLAAGSSASGEQALRVAGVSAWRWPSWPRFSFLLFLIQRQLDPSAAFFLPGARVWELALGCLLATAGESQRGTPDQASGIRNGVAWGSLAALIGVTLAPQDAAPIPMLVSVAATAALITTLQQESPLGRVLNWPPLLRLGVISYSLYLWHWSVIALSRWTIASTPGVCRSSCC